MCAEHQRSEGLNGATLELPACVPRIAPPCLVLLPLVVLHVCQYCSTNIRTAAVRLEGLRVAENSIKTYILYIAKRKRK